MKLKEAIDEFRLWLAPRKLSPATMRAYDQDLRMMSALIAEASSKSLDALKLKEISTTHLRAAFAEYSSDHSRASILRAHSTWNQFYDFLVSDNKAEGNPMAAINRPKQDQRSPKPLDGWADDTVPELLVSLVEGTRKARNPWPERDLAVVATLLATGARSSELTGMDIGSVVGRRDEQVIQVVGKGAKPRSIPVEKQLDELLGTYIETRKERFTGWKPNDRDPLFVSPSSPGDDLKNGGKRLTSNQLYYLLDQSLRAAGMSGKRPAGAMAHAFRHTYGTTLASEGAPVSAIRKLMGHSSINTSQGYIDSLAREEREVAAQNRVYGVLDKLKKE